jgi:uncharacterized protein (TIGR02117 family)
VLRRRPRRRAPAAVAAALLALAALTILPMRPRDPALYPPAPGAPPVTVYVIDNGLHSNVVVPADRLRAAGGPTAIAAADLRPSPWVALGWGDAKFYIGQGVSPARAMDALRALFAPGNPSVVMLEPLRAAPDRLYRDGVIRLELSEAGFARLVARTDRSLRLRNGQPSPHPAPGRGEARFFDSVETFGALHTCNHWTGELLHAAGVPVRPVLDTAASGLAIDLHTAVIPS